MAFSKLTLLMHVSWVKVAGIWLGLAAFAQAQTNQLEYRLVPWAEVSDRQVSDLARFAREQDPGSWYYAESAHVIAYSHQLRDLDVSISQAEFAFDELGRALPVAATGRKAHIILIKNFVAWRALVENWGMRPDGNAFQQGKEIFLMATEAIHPTRIPHEVAHFRLRDSFRPLPLWLEEGLALHYGWSIARDWSRERGQPITRRLDALEESHPLSLDAATALTEYPAGRPDCQSFYRYSEELVAAIGEEVTEAKMGEFVKAMQEPGADWRTVLAGTFGVSAANVAGITALVERRVVTTRDL